jgi:hypothetical protein
MRLLVILCVAPLATAAFQAFAPGRRVTIVRSTAPTMQKGRDADGVGGAAANTFGDIFSSIFKPNAEKQAEIDRAYAEQLEVAERRRNPAAYRKKIAQTEARRAAASQEAYDNIAWQRSANPLEAFKRRQKEGKVKNLGYEDTPKGGIQFPAASFGVGGEFGVGGKFDNGQRFDLRLPYVDQGWVDESSTLKRRSYATKGGAPEQPKKQNWWQPKPKVSQSSRPTATKKKAAAEPAKQKEPPRNPIDWWIAQSTKG